tara:strand:+ start:175 stop:564 length:390 start_codon:yes stop_codon:yes gene_type:complete
MSATVYGTATFGVTAEVGMYAQTLSASYTVDETSLPDESGDDVAAGFTNAGASISINGFVKTGGSAFSTDLGASLAVANSIDAASFVNGAADDDAGETILTGVNLGYGNKQFKSLDITGVFKPFMGAAQ